jgi:hypothetical protein
MFARAWPARPREFAIRRWLTWATRTRAWRTATATARRAARRGCRTPRCLPRWRSRRQGRTAAHWRAPWRARGANPLGCSVRLSLQNRGLRFESCRPCFSSFSLGAYSLPSLPTPTASAGQDVDQREEGDDDHRSDGHDRDCGSGEDHAPLLSRSSLVKTCGAIGRIRSGLPPPSRPATATTSPGEDHFGLALGADGRLFRRPERDEFTSKGALLGCGPSGSSNRPARQATAKNRTAAPEKTPRAPTETDAASASDAPTPAAASAAVPAPAWVAAPAGPIGRAAAAAPAQRNRSASGNE